MSGDVTPNNSHFVRHRRTGIVAPASSSCIDVGATASACWKYSRGTATCKLNALAVEARTIAPRATYYGRLRESSVRLIFAMPCVPHGPSRLTVHSLRLLSISTTAPTCCCLATTFA